MTRLSDQQYWEGKYVTQSGLGTSVKRKGFLQRVIGEGFYRRLRANYSENLLWEDFYRKFLPFGKNIRVLEVGSAPGNNLVKMKKLFGYEPFGVEYTESGVDVNKKLFEQEGINPENVIHADFFSDQFQSSFKEKFDVIYSGGFIEHFTDVGMVIDKHLSLVKSGGIVVVGIPNLRGFNYLLTYLLSKPILKIHNLNIMDKERFAKLFRAKDVEVLLCDYYGTINLELFFTNNRILKRTVQVLLSGSQMFLNLLLDLLLTKRGLRLEHKYFSPYLIFIGKKRPSQQST